MYAIVAVRVYATKLVTCTADRSAFVNVYILRRVLSLTQMLTGKLAMAA